MPASIRVINVNNKEYIQVITYEPGVYGHSRVKILKAFGSNTTANMIEAKIFKANYDILESLKSDPDVNTVDTMGLIEKVGGLTAGAILGWKVIEYLFGKKE